MRSRRRCRRGWRPNRPNEPEHLVRSCWVANAGRPKVPGGADTEPAGWVLPGCWGIGLHGPIGPTPLAIWIEGHVGLHRDPIDAGSERNRYGQGYFENAAAIHIRLGGPGVNERPRQTTTILVEENVEVIGWTSSIERNALRIHFGDLPALAPGHEEVVSDKVGKIGHIRELLRPGADHSRVV